MQRILLGTILISVAAVAFASYRPYAPSYAGSGSVYTASTKLPELSVSLPAELSVSKSQDQDEPSTSSISSSPSPTSLSTFPSSSTSASSSTSSSTPSFSPTTSSSPLPSSTATSSSSSSSTASSTPANENPNESNLIQEVVSELPVTLPSILGELDSPKRRVITYDQRQEGQYNIRADLDNFMIVLIPPSPADGLNLLDLLTKSNLRKTSHSSSKNKKKHYSSSMGLKSDSNLKFRQLLKHPDYYPQQQQGEMEMAASSRVGEFIEGRTPYHVDISSLNGDVDAAQTRLNPDRQVDVLPPPSYPLAYQHLIKPYLEAESSIIQTLPPADLTSHQTVSAESPQNAGFYRFARYIRGDNFLDSNRVTINNRLGSPEAQASSNRITQIPLYRSELSMGASKLYPPLDIPSFSLTSGGRSLEEKKSTNSAEHVDGKQTLDATGVGAGADSGLSGIGGSDISYEDIFLPSAHIRPLEDDLELELHTDDLIDEEAKALLRDGIERCAPGNRRDSYGVCREIEGY